MILTDKTEGPAEYYDNAFKGNTYPNLSHMYRWVIESLLNVLVYNCYLEPLNIKKPFLDVGCGMGRLSSIAYYSHNMIIDGLDFSPVAIELAKLAVKGHMAPTFYLQDYKTFENYNRYNLFIVTEFLEHIEKDVEFFSLLPKKSLVILSVPSPGWGDKYHIRLFQSIKEVIERYESVLDFTEAKIVGPGVTYGAIGIVK